MNFSEWNKTFDEAGESANEVREGEMPIAAYAWLHPAANLSATEKAALIGGLAATFGDEGGRAEGGGAAEGQEEAGDKGREHE